MTVIFSASEMHDEVVDDSVYELKAHEQDCFAVSVAGSRWMITGGEDDVAYLFDQSNTGLSCCPFLVNLDTWKGISLRPWV